MTAPLRLPPGIHTDVPAQSYHLDCAEEPSLSSSIAIELLTRSPLHAKLRHPRLTPQPPENDPTRPKEIGTAAHKLLLGRGGEIVTIDEADYRKDVAKKARAEAYAAGKTPILMCDAELALAMEGTVRQRLGDSGDLASFNLAKSEVVVIARDPNGAWLRIMIDKLEDHGTHAVIWDVKTGEQSAEPSGLGRRISNMGMETQAEFYRHVLALARPELRGKISFKWLFVENEPPHESTIAELDAMGREIGRRKAVHAIEVWQRCLTGGEFPGYPRSHIVVEYPSFAEKNWLEREEAYADTNKEPIDYRMAG
jgi:hypothetical protein